MTYSSPETWFADAKYAVVLASLPEAAATGATVIHHRLNGEIEELTSPALHVIATHESGMRAGTAKPLPAPIPSDIWAWLRDHANDLKDSDRQYAAWVCGLAIVQPSGKRTLIDHTGRVHATDSIGKDEYHGPFRPGTWVDEGLQEVHPLLPHTVVPHTAAAAPLPIVDNHESSAPASSPPRK